MNRITVLCALLAACSVGATAIAEESPVLIGNGQPVQGVALLDERGTEPPVLPPALPSWWKNGTADGLSGLQSQTLNNFNARVADDYILEAGKWSLVSTIKVCMAVSANVATPEAELEIYADCNGKPGALITTLTSSVVSQLPGNPFGPGFKVLQFEFVRGTFDFGALDGCGRIWISPFGRGTGSYFWLTANSGVIQGHQGVFRAPTLGYADWTDTADVTNLMRCTDFCFEVTGDICYAIKDQGDYDLAGLSSIKFPNLDAQDARAADNFQISSAHASVRLCRVEAYLATNCDPTRVFGEIYANECDKPGARLYTLSNPQIIDTTATFDGLPVYCFRFDAPNDVVLQGGRNYWLSMAAVAGGTIFDRAIFLFKRIPQDACKAVNITPGCYKNPFAGVDEFTDVTDLTNNNVPREFAFRLYGAPICPTTTRSLPGDANDDGIVTFADITWVLNNFGSVAAE